LFKEFKFPCERCGQCCRQVYLLQELQAYNRGDGICKYLTKANMCSIYGKRPDICRVDSMYEKIYHQQFTRMEFYQLNKDACDYMRRVAGYERSPRKND